VAMVPIAGGTVTTLATGQWNPGPIVATATGIFWTNLGAGAPHGDIMSLPFTGGVPSTIVTGQVGPIAADSSNFYWAQGSSSSQSDDILSMPLGGGPTTTIAPGVDAADFAVDARNVYYVNQGTNANDNQDGSIVAVPLSGGPAVTLAAAQNSPFSIATDGENVYWTTFGYYEGGTVMKVALDGVAKIGGAGGTP